MADINFSAVDTVYSNSQTTHEWDFVGSSSSSGAYSYSMTTTYTGSFVAEAAILTWLNSNYPPNNYSVGNVIRVYASYNATYWWFGNQMETVTVTNITLNGSTAWAKMYLTFDENGGSTVSNKYVYWGRTYGTLPSTTRSGYTFDGWFTADTGGSQVLSTTTVTSTANHELHAQWTSAGPTSWGFVGESSSSGAYSYNYAVYTGDYFGHWTVAQTWLTNNYPPSNYSMGYRIRVYSFSESKYRWFVAQ